MSERVLLSDSCEIVNERKLEHEDDPAESLDFFAMRLAEFFTSDACKDDKEAGEWWDFFGRDVVGDAVWWDDDLHETYPCSFQPGQTMKALYMSKRQATAQ